MATSNGFPRAIVVSFVFFYFLVFMLSTVGNCLVLSICYRAIKRKASSLKWFIANLAIADLTFTFLSILDFITFIWTWLGGQVTCKLQHFLIEACYTASIMTLVVISFERLKAVIEPFSTRTRAPEGVYRKLAGLWFVSLVAASPLLYASQAHEDSTGGVSCSNIGFTDLGRQICYSIHSICFFLVPLIYMIYAQRSIFVTLRSSVFPTQNCSSAACSKLRHRKAAKPLVAVTVAFVGCWSPFIITRLLLYFQLTDDGYIWRASQLLIFVNTALDPILYGIYGENLKSSLKRFLTCTVLQTSAAVGTPTDERIMRRVGNNTCRPYDAKS
ncbi:somatostatin receptor type 1-like [Orbicella faveolata]|uniref:somatostatin receptor type 1-like n=1 Tax=Orbicella faveolata TaxID=48498 RepID=UPI0009E24BCD|nr:somatostatin receptor type 1-like [Orbicella faveolata]XP_020610551.1 somatostatin receptor type 1-like [Orbicella faveolata]